MAHIKQGNIFGRLGTALGRSLSEQVPKEIERSRFRQGVEYLGKEGANMSNFQKLGYLQSLPGTTPQFTASAADLLNRESQTKALQDQRMAQQQSFQRNAPQPGANQQPSKTPSLTQEDILEKVQQGFIPRTEQQKLNDAIELYNQNPGAYPGGIQDARAQVDKEEATEEKIANAYATKHQNLSALQDNVVKRLKSYSEGLGVKVPPSAYSKIEDDAIQATKPKAEGGRGLDEQQAMKDYGDKLRDASIQYSNLATVGNWEIVGRKSGESLRSLKELRKDFKERGDLENMAETMISKNKLSPNFAYALAQPVHEIPALNQEMKKIPEIKQPSLSLEPRAVLTAEQIRQKTLDYSKKLAEHLGKEGSPLAVAYELKKRGYDPAVWLDYLNNNRDIQLSKKQRDQLSKSQNIIGNLNDWWLQSFTGVE